MNKNLNCVRIQEKLTRMNCAEIFQNFDVILDCTDNVPTRYLVNDVCVLLNKPLVAGNAIKFEGQLLVCIPGKTSCYRCLFPSPPSRECVGSCNEDGVLGSSMYDNKNIILRNYIFSFLLLEHSNHFVGTV